MKLFALIRRNFKLFFKDKGMFSTSLITPVILLVRYVAFLGKVYNNAFTLVDVALWPALTLGQSVS